MASANVEMSFIQQIQCLWPEVDGPTSSLFNWQITIDIVNSFHPGCWFIIRISPSDEASFDDDDPAASYVLDHAFNEPLVLFRESLSSDDFTALKAFIEIFRTVQGCSIEEALGFLVNAFIATLDVTTSGYLRSYRRWPISENLYFPVTEQGTEVPTWVCRPLFSVEFFLEILGEFFARASEWLFGETRADLYGLSYMTIPPKLNADFATKSRKFPVFVDRHLVPVVTKSAEYLSEVSSLPGGIDSISREPSLPIDNREERNTPIFWRQSSTWVIDYLGTPVLVRDSRGMKYISLLVSRPNKLVHVLELIAYANPPEVIASVDQIADARALFENESTQVGRKRRDFAVLDDQAKADYQNRLNQLNKELSIAEQSEDKIQYTKIEEEKKWILNDLKNASGFGGRDRTFTSAPERGRTAVNKAIRSAIAKIAEASPELARHLDRSIDTGLNCVYNP